VPLIGIGQCHAMTASNQVNFYTRTGRTYGKQASKFLYVHVRPLSPRRPSHVSVAADIPPDLSSNASAALRAARADDRLYVPLCLNRLERVINGGMPLPIRW